LLLVDFLGPLSETKFICCLLIEEKAIRKLNSKFQDNRKEIAKVKSLEKEIEERNQRCQ
jgi:hypothetical protein